MLYAGNGGALGKIRRKLKIRTSFMKRQDDTFGISQGVEGSNVTSGF